MKLSQLTRARPTQTTVDLGDDTRITIVYDRAIITHEWPAKGSTRLDRLAHLLISWDVTGDDGQPYQPDANLNGERPAAWAALLAPLPPDVLRVVEEAIWDDYYAGKPLGGGSHAG